MHRNSTAVESPPPDAITDAKHWDDDLIAMDRSQLLEELFRIQQAVRTHRDIINRERTWHDDKLLYTVLPEKLPANFMLPHEQDFLGEARSPHAGCPSF